MYDWSSLYGWGDVNPMTSTCPLDGASVVGSVVGGATKETKVLFTALKSIVDVDVDVDVVVDSGVVVGVVTPSIQHGSKCPLICISIALLSVSTVAEHAAGPPIDRKYTS